jgi:hypothetical protein
MAHNTIQWGMVSASQFSLGSDLVVEIVALPINFIETLGYVAPTYVFLDGNEYHADSVKVR